MSKNNLYIETEIPYFSTNFHSMNNSYLDSLIIPTEKGFNNTCTLAQLPNLNLNKTKTKKSAHNARRSHLPFDNNYLKERYNKVKEENSQLKKKLFESEKNYKVLKGQMEEQILVLRDENTNLQLQIQKTIEKQKTMFKDSDNISIENKSLINKINLMNIDINTLNDKITMKNADVEEKNKIINDLLKEKNVFIKEEKMLKNQINELMKDKEVLIKQIQDLNLIIGEKISPKLKQNENTLINLQKEIERLRINNEKFRSDNALLFKKGE
jgi:chromosome segregation ATPase